MADAGLWAGVSVLSGDLAGYGRELGRTSAYAVLIAAISGPMPKMFITR